MTTHPVQTLEELKKQVESFHDKNLEYKLSTPSQPLFRGHSSARWELETTAERHFDKRTLEVGKYNNFLRRIYPTISTYTGRAFTHDEYLEEQYDFAEWKLPNLELMVYTRHHSLPSPLLDWSSSLYVASYFAFRDADPKKDNDVAVYEYVSRSGSTQAYWACGAKIIQIDKYLIAHPRHFDQQSQYSYCIRKTNDRWEYCSHNLVFEHVFVNDDRRNDLLEKYTLPSSLKEDIIERLDTMNINEYTLFKSEDGLLNMLLNRERASFDR